MSESPRRLPSGVTVHRAIDAKMETAACLTILQDAYGAWAAPVAQEKLSGDSPTGPATLWLARSADQTIRGFALATGAYLRLLAVTPTWQARGLGSELLQVVEAACNSSTLHVHAEPGNYLQPGVELTNIALRTWLARRGYREGATCSNLRVALRNDPTRSDVLSVPRKALTLDGVAIAIADDAGRIAALPMISDTFHPAWAYECARATTLWLATTPRDGIIGFAATGGNNSAFGWFGPTGTRADFRGRGVGTALLGAALHHLGRSQATTVIPWTTAEAFYQRACAARVEQRFVAMSKTM